MTNASTLGLCALDRRRYLKIRAARMRHPALLGFLEWKAKKEQVAGLAGAKPASRTA